MAIDVINTGKEKRVKGVKGMYYTLVSIILIGVVSIALFIYSEREYKSQQEIHIESVRNIADYLSRTERELKYATERYTKEAIKMMIEDVKKYGFLENSTISFKEHFLNGTEEDSFLRFIELTESEARTRGISLSLDVIDLKIEHVDPFILKTEVLLKVDARNRMRDAFWNYQTTITSFYNIEGEEDPLYIGKSNNYYTQKIYHSPFEILVNDTDNRNDTTNLKKLYQNSYYTMSDDAPSFLKRFEGDLSRDENGIESFVRKEKLQISLQQNKTLIDHLYFSTTRTDDVCNVQNMPSEFRIDTTHISRYEIEGRLEYTFCG